MLYVLINAAIPLPKKWFGVLISFRSQNALMGSQNGFFGQYLGNGKKIDPETMLYSHKCGHSDSIKVVQGPYLVRIPKCPN